MMLKESEAFLKCLLQRNAVETFTWNTQRISSGFPKKWPDLVGSSDDNLASTNGKLVLKRSWIASLSIDTLFVNIGTFSAEISMLKVQVCCHLRTRAFAVLTQANSWSTAKESTIICLGGGKFELPRLQFQLSKHHHGRTRYQCSS